MDRTKLENVRFDLGRRMFEFAKEAAPLFLANKWRWNSISTSERSLIPNENDLVSVLDALIHKAFMYAKKDGMHGDCSTGKLQVRFSKSGENWCGYMELIPLTKMSI